MKKFYLLTALLSVTAGNIFAMNGSDNEDVETASHISDNTDLIAPDVDSDDDVVAEENSHETLQRQFDIIKEQPSCTFGALMRILERQITLVEKNKNSLEINNQFNDILLNYNYPASYISSNPRRARRLDGSNNRIERLDKYLDIRNFFLLRDSQVLNNVQNFDIQTAVTKLKKLQEISRQSEIYRNDFRIAFNYTVNNAQKLNDASNNGLPQSIIDDLNMIKLEAEIMNRGKLIIQRNILNQ